MEIDCSNEGTHGHRREQAALLAGPEKRLLVWMARRLPPWIAPDHLSLVGLAAMLLAGLSFHLASRSPGWLLVVVAGLALNWFGDSMDGTVARVRDRQRPRYGYYVDHLLDIVGTVTLVAGMGLSEFMSLPVALSFLVAYLAVSAESYLATHASGVFRMSLLRIGPTELRILLAAGVLHLLHSPWVAWGSHRFLLFDVGGVVAAIVLALGFVVVAARNVNVLARRDPPPEARSQSKDGSTSAAGSSLGNHGAATGPKSESIPQAVPR